MEEGYTGYISDDSVKGRDDSKIDDTTYFGRMYDGSVRSAISRAAFEISTAKGEGSCVPSGDNDGTEMNVQIISIGRLREI